MSESNTHLASEFLQAFLPFIILDYRARGGPTDHDWEVAQQNLSQVLEPTTGSDKRAGAIPFEGGAEFLYRLPTSGKAMSVLMRGLAVLSFAPSGVAFLGVRYFGSEADEREWKNLHQMRIGASDAGPNDLSGVQERLSA
jgi:hypothetical protein